jgi:VIT1/CCC1 family predicted Fe2+/Mn2+ transporter
VEANMHCKPDVEYNMKLLDSHTRERYLFISVALLLLASLAALLMYVPIMPLAFTFVIVLGLILMFAFGFYVGNKEETPPHSAAPHQWPHQ